MDGNVCDIQFVIIAMVLSTTPIFSSGTDMVYLPLDSLFRHLHSSHCDWKRMGQPVLPIKVWSNICGPRLHSITLDISWRSANTVPVPEDRMLVRRRYWKYWCSLYLSPPPHSSVEMTWLVETQASLALWRSAPAHHLLPQISRAHASPQLAHPFHSVPVRCCNQMAPSLGRCRIWGCNSYLGLSQIKGENGWEWNVLLRLEHLWRNESWCFAQTSLH